ncbi:MAG: outer membrane beta-barrel protein [Methylococcales bacterium]
MFKKAFLFALMLSLAAPFAYAAPDRTAKLDMGVNISAALSTDSGIDDTYYVGGSWAYGVYEWLAIGFEAGWMSADTEITIGSSLINTGDISGIPVFADFIFRLPVKDSQVNPYAVVAPGAIFWDREDSDVVTNAGFEADADSSFAIKFGGGVDWFVDNNWIVYFEGAFVLASSDISVTSSAGTTFEDDQDLNYWTVGGGIKYLFA